jgi:drug/metabolite transporter (DMT)-like permease
MALLAETPSPMQLAGVALVVLGIAVATLGTRHHRETSG